MSCRVCGAALPEHALFCGECGSSVTASRLRRADVEDHRTSDTTLVEPLPRPARAGHWPDPVEKSPALPVLDRAGDVPASEQPAHPVRESAQSAARFTLRFSSGGSESVTGPVLLGRRPAAQPGETPHRLVAISDPGRSVSKTHLEFGIEGDDLWVCDRFSANGTVLRPSGARARLCEPGRRYRVARGTRIEIGEQYVDVI